ncbi:hypothetical protein F4677DRAFT_162959 [Hypoxylon crocopeplum]|nr:hypothetical protein F4677DRAFT_162959 [Hypoxylon crocopeplum]
MTTTKASPAKTAGSSRPCNRCKEHEGTIDLRGAESVCKSCFAYYVSSKAIKRLEALQRETSRNAGKGQNRRPQRYLVGLSLGPSSTALLHVLTENVRQQRARGQKTSRFEYVVVHVVDDTSSSPTAGEDLLSPYRAHFPDAELQAVPLGAALHLPSIDWTALPRQNASLLPAQRLADVLERLPSATSRADIRRLLVRHLLIAAATDRGCDALLLGHSTTSLAELTLSETAKGRGFSLPWLVNDGAAPVPASLCSEAQSTAQSPTPLLPMYSPLRELFRKELHMYLSQTTPPLTSLLSPSSSSTTSQRSKAGAVVSHRDQSIDDVLARYFGEVEASYPSVVANVVRTTGKLERRAPSQDNRDNGGGSEGEEEEGNGNLCGLCGAALDELGDERWRGEIGDEAVVDSIEGEAEDANSRGKKLKLCYGCERSTRG